MELKERISGDLKEAMRSRDDFKVGTLRFLLSSIQTREIEKRGNGLGEKLTDEEVEEVLKKEAKKRRESFEVYEKGGRSDLAEKEKKELECIRSYLPPEMSDADLEKIVEEAIVSVRPAGPKDFGKVIGEVMKRAKGGAEASRVGQLVKEKLSS